MKEYIINDKEKIIVIGDIHGEFSLLRHNIKSYGFKNSAIIVCGDCGIGFNKPKYYDIELGKLDKFLNELNNTIYFIRGNHDDPSYFRDEVINLKCIKTIPDYSVIIANDNNILCIGGAISIDRTWRKSFEEKINRHKPKSSFHRKLYWEDEKIVYDEELLDAILKKYNINYICTHTFNIKDEGDYSVEEKTWLKNDPTLEKDLQEERETINKIDKKIGKHITKWLFGHYHKSYTKKNYRGLSLVIKDYIDYYTINNQNNAKSSHISVTSIDSAMHVLRGNNNINIGI